MYSTHLATGLVDVAQIQPVDPIPATKKKKKYLKISSLNNWYLTIELHRDKYWKHFE
jgi:hypothetical protein